jgi:hypothetical protein
LISATAPDWHYRHHEAGNHRRPRRSRQSTLAARLGEITGLPVTKLDKLFWRPGLAATPPGQWAATQRQLAARESWIMDGDLGPYDVLEVQLQAADTVVFLDFSPLRCAWRAIRRSRERADFWRWLLAYRRRSRPPPRQAIAAHARLISRFSGTHARSGDSLRG